MEKENDVQLIQRILSGDEAAFDVLVQRHQKSVHALAWRKIGDFHDAEEITQDTFLQVYKKLPTLKDPYKFAGWLYVITNRLCIDRMREKNFTIQSLEDTPVEEVEKSSYTHHVSEQRRTEITERRRAIVKKLLEKLPESERTVMILHYLGEMTVKEISKFLGVSANAIHNRLYRARKRLQEEESLLIQEVFSGVQIPTSVKENIMRRAADIKLTPTPASKPLLPWIAFGTAVVLVALLLGVSNQHLIRFQRPYSFEASSEPTIEIVDTDIVLDIASKPAVRNQLGRATLTRKNSGASTQVSHTASTPNTFKNSRRQLSVMEKVQTRSLPSITASWAEWFVNKHHLSYAEMTASHDMFWSPEFGLRFQRTDKDVSLVGDWIEARRQQETLLDLNPNMIFLCEVNMRGADPGSLFLKELYSGDDFPWITDASGEIILGTPAEQYTDLLIDFTHPIAQDIIVAQAIAVAESGLWDGILFSYWNEKRVVLKGYRSYEADSEASVIERLNSRDFPSLFGAWAEPCMNLSPQEIGPFERAAVVDLVIGFRLREQRFEKIDGKIVITTPYLEDERERFSKLRRENPNMIFFMGIPLPVAPLADRTLFGKDIFPDDFPWVPNATQGIGSEHDPAIQVRIMDFTHPDVQETIVRIAEAVDASEFYDGIVFDWWNEEGLALQGYRTLSEEQAARTQILQSIRNRVSDDFLIIVNGNSKTASVLPHISMV